MYNNDDIDAFLLKARKQKDSVLPSVEKIACGTDAVIIRSAISNNDFVAEDFYRYDSDVCEQFLHLMELVGIAK